MRACLGLLVAALSVCGARAAEVAASVEGGLTPVKVLDLHYGDALWHYYQDDYSGALVRLLAYGEQGLLKDHADDAQLLEGGLYLSLGLHREAARIFERMLARRDVFAATRARAWFYLGKLRYKRGYFPEAEQALAAAAGALPTDLEAERRLLVAQSMMARGRFDDAAAELASWDGPAGMKAYGQFNLGVALVRSGRGAEGLALLDRVGTGAPGDEESLALRDKANLALGFARLQAGQPDEARAALERVRLNGPQSNKALLGAGWADANAGRFKEALVPWLELHGRNLLDAAVQESYLAVPYAFAKLDANRQAAEYYESAIASYEAESARLAESIAAIRAGRLLEAVARADRGGQEGWFWQLRALPDSPESRYLYHLMASNEFQEGLKNHRALESIGRDLATWSETVTALEDMVMARQRAFDTKLPAAAQRLDAVDIEALDRRRDALQARLDAAEREGDAVAVATAAELQSWSRVRALEESIAAAGDDPGLADAREKLRLAKGVLLWRMSAAYKARAWQARRHLKELDAALFEARTGLAGVSSARTSMPQRNVGFATRIDAVKPRLESLTQRVAAAREAQARYLAGLAIRELESQQQRLAAYTVQARYALATLYDRASSPGGGSP